jgi:hypothetical protein
MTQLQMYYRSVAQAHECNMTFLFFVEQGMTAPELRALIARRPELWGRFENWLDKLPQ